MIINKRNRDEALRKGIELLKDKSGEETMNAVFILNRVSLEMCKASIKEKNPNINKKQMLKELNKIYWKNG